MNRPSEASKVIIDQTGFNGDTAVILGSGLGGFTDALTDHRIIEYSNIPYYPKSTVEGHSGEMVIGKLEDKDLLVARGRVHCYEGYPREMVVFPIHVFKKCGIEYLIITNSSGSLDKQNDPGTIMVITGHLDCTFHNNIEDPDLIEDEKFHSSHLIAIAESVASTNNIALTTGNYCWTMGPMYETPAEIKYFRSLSGSAVGMSTLPEIEEAGSLGLNVLTLSLLTNFAAGISDQSLTHEEVLINAERSKDKMIKLLSGIIKRIKQ